MDEKFFELFCIKIDIAKYFEKCRNLLTQIFCFAHFGNPLK